MNTEVVFVEPLTRREREVICLMAEGLDNKAIGKALCIEWRTARSHVCNILSKLGARNRTHAVLIALQAGMIEAEKPITFANAVALAAHYAALAQRLMSPLEATVPMAEE